MGKILVTGASGDIGRKTLQHLLKMKPASELAGLARDPAKAQDLADLGIELRQGDYLDPASLDKAFADVDKLMLVSTHAFTDRNTAHGNVIDAAVKAGVKHLVYMPIIRQAGTTFTMKEITEEDLFAENKIKTSGLNYTLAAHPPFLDVLGFYIGKEPQETGVRVIPGDGKFAAASRDDLAAAHAAILTGEGHENKTYALSGDPAVSFADIAQVLSEIHGKYVPYTAISNQEYLNFLLGAGVPHSIAHFVFRWVEGMGQGEWDQTSGDLERLIGRKPTSAADYLREAFPSATVAGGK